MRTYGHMPRYTAFQRSFPKTSSTVAYTEVSWCEICFWKTSNELALTGSPGGMGFSCLGQGGKQVNGR